MPLDIWFVNVGHGDSTIVRFPSGRVMMVDINNCKSLPSETKSEVLESVGVVGVRKALYQQGGAYLTEAEERAIKSYEDRLDDPIDVLKRNVLGAEQGDVFRFIASHPDLDHLTGLYRLAYQEPGIMISNFWDTLNNKQLSEFKNDEDRRNWLAYQQLRKGQKAGTHVLFKQRMDSGEYWTDDGMVVLTPTPEITYQGNEREDWNHLSYVFMLTYGKSRVILPADASIESQEEMAQFFGSNLTSTILKAPHHGRKSGYCGDFVKNVSPDYTIVSVGAKPETDGTDLYRHYTNQRVLTTLTQGTICARLHEDGTIEIYDHLGRRLDLCEDQQPTKQAATWNYGR